MTAAPLHFRGERLMLDPLGGLAWPDEGVLAAADLHLEKGTAAASRGQLVPPWDSQATLDRLALLVRRWQPRILVLLGDSFHDARGAARLTSPDRQRLAHLAADRRLIWVLGNHDPLPPEGLPGEAVDAWSHGGIVFRHEARRGTLGEVSGHYHPKAAVQTRAGRVTRPCFVTDARRIILPALGAYAGGLDVGNPAIAGLFPRGGRAFLLGEGACSASRSTRSRAVSRPHPRRFDGAQAGPRPGHRLVPPGFAPRRPARARGGDGGRPAGRAALRARRRDAGRLAAGRGSTLVAARQPRRARREPARARVATHPAPRPRAGGDTRGRARDGRRVRPRRANARALGAASGARGRGRPRRHPRPAPHGDALRPRRDPHQDRRNLRHLRTLPESLPRPPGAPRAASRPRRASPLPACPARTGWPTGICSPPSPTGPAASARLGAPAKPPRSERLRAVPGARRPPLRCRPQPAR